MRNGFVETKSYRVALALLSLAFVSRQACRKTSGISMIFFV